MGKASVKLIGFDEAVKKLQQYAVDKVEGVKSITEQAAKAVKNNAVSNAPVRTGRLRDSLDDEILDGGLSGRVRAQHPKGAHAHLVEFGTGPRRQKNGMSTGSAPAQPFLFPAWESERPKYISELTKELRKIK